MAGKGIGECGPGVPIFGDSPAEITCHGSARCFFDVGKAYNRRLWLKCQKGFVSLEADEGKGRASTREQDSKPQ